MIDLVLVGKKIADLRCEHHLSQDQLADVLLVSRQAISAWETGKSAPSIDNIIELAKAFNVSFEEVLCLKDKSEIDPEDPYQGHDREFVLRSVINGSLKVDMGQLLYRSTGIERMQLLKAANDGRLALPLSRYQDKLTREEIAYLTKGGHRQ
ncbi:MAG: helix-turn-helix transcriptional regulator [Bacilli bacterium]|nr:helix-turn-helix domain-containing protein [Bacteroidales bacterium]